MSSNEANELHDEDNNDSGDADSGNVGKRNCLAAFWSEFQPCQPWFRVKEPSTMRTLDVPATFGPSGRVALFSKIVFCGYAISTQVLAYIESDELSFYYAYFTSWALGFAVLYTITSLLNTIFPPSQPKGTRVQPHIKWTWIIFTLASFGQTLATVIFWALVHDWGDSVSYLDLATHGIVFLTVLVEGFIVNRIPLRWMHMWIAFTIVVIFIIWSVIHGPLVLDIGNPNESDNDPDTNDDAIYADLSWDDDDIDSTVILVAVVVFVGVPVIFGILRAISLWHWPCCCTSDRRRYIRTAEDVNSSSHKGMEIPEEEYYNDETDQGREDDDSDGGHA